MARYGRRKQAQLLENTGIVRNRLKIAASIDTARAVLDIRSEYGSLAGFVWAYVDGRTLQNRRENWRDIPARTDESRAPSKALKLHGCRFWGPTICYAFMQAVCMVNDRVTGCYASGSLHADSCPGRCPGSFSHRPGTVFLQDSTFQNY